MADHVAYYEIRSRSDTDPIGFYDVDSLIHFLTWQYRQDPDLDDRFWLMIWDEAGDEYRERPNEFLFSVREHHFTDGGGI